MNGKGIFIIVLMLFVLSVTSVFATTQVSVISTNPSPIIAGEYADVTVEISQGPLFFGDSLEDVRFTIKETDFIKPIPQQELFVREIFAGQSLTKTFRVFFSENIPAGSIPITVVRSQRDTKVEMSDSIFIQGTALRPILRIGEARSIPTRLLSDSLDNQITFIVQNLGDRPAELVSARFMSEYIEESYFQSLQTSVAQIPGSSQAELTFDFDILPTQVQDFPSTIVLEYRVRNDIDNTFDIVLEELDFQISLARTPRFVIVDSQPKTEIRVGQSDVQLVFTITNENVREGDSVRLRLFPDPSAPFDFDKTTYFITPKLEQGDMKSVLIEFDVLDSALIQDYTIRAEIDSLIGTNRYVQDVQVIVPVTKEARSTLQQNAILLVIVFLVISALIGYLYTKRKKND